MGEIRLQWWRDAIEGFRRDDAASGNPVADALGAAVRRYDLPTSALLAMTQARAFDLYPDPMPDRGAFEGYITKTEAMPFALALSVLGVESQSSAMLGGWAGASYGRARLLADLPHRLQRGRNPLPVDMLTAHGVDGDRLLAGNVDAPFRAVVGELAGEIRDAARSLESRWRELPRNQRTALLPIATIASYLAGLETPARNPLREPFELQPLTRVWQMARAHWIGP